MSPNLKEPPIQPAQSQANTKRSDGAASELDASDSSATLILPPNMNDGDVEPKFEAPNNGLPELVESEHFRKPRFESRISSDQPDDDQAMAPSPVRTPVRDVNPLPDQAGLPDFESPSPRGVAMDRVATDDTVPQVALQPNSVSPSSIVPVADPVQENLDPVDLEPPVANAPNAADLAVSERRSLEPTLSGAVSPEDVEPKGLNRTMPMSLRRDSQLLLLFDEQEQVWQRVTSDLQLQENDHLLGMPAFRSELEIGSSLTCTIYGVARLRLGPDEDLTILDGKLVLAASEAGVSQGIRFRGRRFEINMIDPATRVALEAYHAFLPGADVGQDKPHAMLKVYPLDHSISVDLMDQSIELPLGRHMVAVNEYAPMTAKTIRGPKWMREDSVKRIDALTRDSWELTAETDFREFLQIRSDSARPNQRSLAARCLAEMDDFAALVGSLSNPSQSIQAYSESHFLALQNALTRGAAVQEQLQFQLEQAYGGEQAKLMMEMLRGYNNQQLASGSAQLLVRHLEHPNLELRTLAIENLYQITGARSDFRPADNISSRSRAVRSWNKRLAAGKVKYDPPTELERRLKHAAEQLP